MSKLKPVQILVVENDKEHAKHTIKILSSPNQLHLNFKTTYVCSVEDAFKELKKREFDAILVDFYFQDSSKKKGFKKILKTVKHVPIIIIIEVQKMKAAVEAMRSGVQSFIFREDVFSEKLIITLWDALQKANLERSKEDFLSMVSHELRTPVTGIQNMIDNALEGVYGEIEKDLEDALSMALTAASRLNGMLKELLLISKMDSLNVHLAIEACEVKGLIEESLFYFKKEAELKDINIKIEIDSTVPIIYCDKNRILQVFTNLIDNAIKFSPSGGNINICSTEQSAQNICFSVADSGIGIDDSDKENIFKKFFQVQKSHERGLGLGLAIVKHIMDLHKGQIWVEDNSPQGAKFYFSLPKKMEGPSHE